MLESRRAIGNRTRSDRRAIRARLPTQRQPRAERVEPRLRCRQKAGKGQGMRRLLFHLYLNLSHRLDFRQHALILPHNAFV